MFNNFNKYTNFSVDSLTSDTLTLSGLPAAQEGYGVFEYNPIFSGNSKFSVSIKKINTSRPQHYGVWFYDESRTNWYLFCFQNTTNQIGVYRLIDQNPSKVKLWSDGGLHENLPSNFDFKINSTFEIEVLNGNVLFKLNGVTKLSISNPFSSYRFGLFIYEGVVASFSNLNATSLKGKTSFNYWRISNIKNRGSDQTYKSVGNLLFKTKTGEESTNPSQAISESNYSPETSAAKAFDKQGTTYSLSQSSSENTWWIGYRFDTSVEISSLEITMRHDMNGVIDNITDNSLGQEWDSFQIDGSEDGITWEYVYSCYETKIFKNDTSVHRYDLETFKTTAKWWRISNIRNRLEYSPNYGQSVAELKFITKENVLSDNQKSAFSNGSFVDINSTIDTYKAAKAFDGDINTFAASPQQNPNEPLFWNIGYKFEQPVEVTGVSIRPRQDMVISYGQEWQTADLEYSFNGTVWFFYGKINPKVTSMDLSLKENIPVIPANSKILTYTTPQNTDNRYKFWRCSNINTLPSYVNSSFDISGSILKFINTENLNLANKENSFSTSSAIAEIGKGTPSNGFDNNPLTWFHSQYPEGLNNILKNYENYSIGCMFEEPVEVVKIGYKPRPDMDINWGQEWQTCNIEYSPNGFDWFQKGYCDFNIKRLSSEYVVKDIQPTDALESFQHWRVSKVFNQGSAIYPQFTGYNQGFSGWELRFNTLTGERSNDSSRGYSNGSWDASWTPDRAFDGNIQSNAGGFHQKKDNDSQFYIAYKFNTPQHVNSISILPRRDSDLPHQSWLLAHIEASHDGIDWEFRGYANLNCGSNTRFYTARLEDLSLFDSLNSSDLTSTIKNLDIYNPESNGIYRGQVLEVNEPVVKQVALYERNTRRLVAIVWSDSEGFYEFKNLNQNKTYYVHAIDNNKIYNAVTKDMLDLRINSEYK